MTDHERLHEQREREADGLERENERVGERVEEAKDANASLESDEFIATPAHEVEDEGEPADED